MSRNNLHAFFVTDDSARWRAYWIASVLSCVIALLLLFCGIEKGLASVIGGGVFVVAFCTVVLCYLVPAPRLRLISPSRPEGLPSRTLRPEELIAPGDRETREPSAEKPDSLDGNQTTGYDQSIPLFAGGFQIDTAVLMVELARHYKRIEARCGSILAIVWYWKQVADFAMGSAERHSAFETMWQKSFTNVKSGGVVWDVRGDLIQRYRHNAEQYGRTQAFLWYWQRRFVWGILQSGAKRAR